MTTGTGGVSRTVRIEPGGDDTTRRRPARVATIAWQQLRGNNCVATFAWKLRGNICVATIAWQHLARLGNICGQHLRGNICVATFAWQHLRGNATTTRRRSQNLFPKNHSSNPHSDSHPDPQKKIEVRHFLIQNVGGSVTVSEHVGGQKNLLFQACAEFLR